MKNWFNALFFLIVFLSQNIYAQTPPDAASAAPKPDEKKTVTVLTTDSREEEPGSKDFLSRLFTPVGDATFGFIKGASDLIGTGCQGVVDLVDHGFQKALTPLGAKPGPGKPVKIWS